jgi:hypothetical protein
MPEGWQVDADCIFARLHAAGIAFDLPPDVLIDELRIVATAGLYNAPAVGASTRSHRARHAIPTLQKNACNLHGRAPIDFPSTPNISSARPPS